MLICGGIYAPSMYFVVRVRCRHKDSSRSLSYLLMSFLFLFITVLFHALLSSLVICYLMKYY